MTDLDFRDKPAGPSGDEPAVRINIYGDINQRMAARVAAQLEGAPEAGAINLHIDSNGGEFGPAFDIFVLLRRHRAATKIAHVVRAESGAALVMLAADHRIAMPGAPVLLHGAAIAVQPGRWTADQHADAADLLRWVDDQQAAIFAYRTGRPAEIFATAMGDEESATPEWLLANNLIHEIKESA